jgi:hypothetical protein
MKQSHHIPPHRPVIAVVRPTLRRSPATMRWRITNVLTVAAALFAVILSVSLSSAATNQVCAMSLDRAQTVACG